MSKIKFFALGGLDEIGKNSYVIEVDKSIFIFDCGLKYASGNLLGIDYIIPDFSYLVKNKDKIKGLFLTNGHEDNIGGVDDLLKEIPDLKIYASKFTKFMLLEEGINPKNIIEINANKKISFKELSVFPINVSNSIPDSLMYTINTPDGAICYTGDFIIDPKMYNEFDMDLGKIAYIGKQGVLALITESLFSERKGHTSPKHHLTEFFEDAFNHIDKRVIISVLPEHLYTIKEIFKALENKHRKVVLMGKKLQRIVNFAKKEGYLKFNDDLIGDLKNLKDEKAVIIVANEYTNPFGHLNRLIKDFDKYITLLKDDTVIIAEPRLDSLEKVLIKLENELSKYGCNVINLPAEKTVIHHASSEDLMLMIKLLNPTYYIPARGEYRYMVGNANLANSLGIEPKNIILKQNGEQITIDNKKLLEKTTKIKVDSILIDGDITDDIGDLVIKDREMLSENGIVLISATIDKKTKNILVGPEISTRGFVYIKDSHDLLSEIKEISRDVIEKNTNSKFVDFNNIRHELRSTLSKFLYDQTESKPMIIAVVQEV